MQFPLTQVKESQILSRLEHLLAANALDKAAKATGFVKRKSKLECLSLSASVPNEQR